jgi:RimJ/RimL family protein N-acetyltransferase/mannose-6-phosphate isomerase-like protein (cupin superfamily)
VSAVTGPAESRPTHPAVIRTPRLELVCATLDMLRAELASPDALEATIEARVPAGWPPELYDTSAIQYSIAYLEQHPDDAPWGFYYFVHADSAGERTVVGVGGFKGAPAQGAVEIGYSIVDSFRRRGFATEAVRGFLSRAFADPRVRRVLAETLPALAPSIGVLEKVGMTFVGDGSEPGVIRYAISREDYISDMTRQPRADAARAGRQARSGAHISVSDAMSRLAEDAPQRSVELFRHGTLTVKMYAPRGRDTQTPHTRDEAYVIARGSGKFFDGVRTVACAAGDFLFAPAGVTHRFEDFTDDFFAWVLFYGPEGGEEAQAPSFD